MQWFMAFCALLNSTLERKWFKFRLKITYFSINLMYPSPESNACIYVDVVVVLL